MATTTRAMLTAAVLAAAMLASALLFGSAAQASPWTASLDTGSTGQAQTESLPSAPTSVSAACVSSTQKSVKVTWSAVTHATSYYVLQSTTSATSGYTVVASGVVTTTWTSGSLAQNHSYWYEVIAAVGVNWYGASSAATGSTTISNSSPNCRQP